MYLFNKDPLSLVKKPVSKILVYTKRWLKSKNLTYQISALIYWFPVYCKVISLAAESLCNENLYLEIEVIVIKGWYLLRKVSPR